MLLWLKTNYAAFSFALTMKNVLNLSQFHKKSPAIKSPTPCRIHYSFQYIEQMSVQLCFCELLFPISSYQKQVMAPSTKICVHESIMEDVGEKRKVYL